MVHYGQTPESAAFYGHLFGCQRCIGRMSDFCDTGRTLWSKYDAPLAAEDIVSEPSLHRRRYLLSLVPEWERPDVERLVRARWEELQFQKTRDK